MHIPNDVIVEIFSKLPAKTLLRFRWLCKYCFKLITDPNFVKMHFNNVHATNNPLVLISSHGCHKPRRIQEFLSLISMDDVLLLLVNIKAPLPFTSSRGVTSRILGSCNGLLCIRCSTSTSPYPKIFIWNPCTKEYKIISGDDSVIIPRRRTLISYGFGYDCSIDDYKVIRNVCSLKDNANGYNGETLISIHTLGTSSSKKLRNNRFFLGTDNGVSINGDLYWKASLTGSEPFNIIVAFDLAKEEYRQITSKPFINHDESDSMYLGKLKGCLCVLRVTANLKSMEVWVMNHNIDDMKKEYSWDILYTISAPWSRNFVRLKPLRFCKNGEIAMMMDSDLILYDPESNQIRFLYEVRGMVSVETYIESLVPLKGGTYIDGPPSIATDKPKRKMKRPLRFLGEY